MMADDQQAQTFSEDQPDTRGPDEARQAELRAAYREGSDSPYKGVEIRTLGEVQWILQERHWWIYPVMPEGMKRADLSGALLPSVNLSGIILTHANLSGVDLTSANLYRADLMSANLSGAQLWSANLSNSRLASANLSDATLLSADLSNTDLTHTNLTHADLVFANLSEADLAFANLSGTILANTNLRGANLREARCDGNTILGKVGFASVHMSFDMSFDSSTKLGDIRWNGVSLLRVNWKHLMHGREIRLGDEQHISQPVTETGKERPPTRQERMERIETATRAYIGLAKELRDQHLLQYASAARLRYQRLHRQALFLQQQPGAFVRGIGSWLLDLISGYGEIPERILIAYLSIIAFFSAIYWGMAHQAGVPPFQWYEAIVLSFSNFHGRGFFTSTLNLGEPVAVVAVCEAIIGIFIELMVIALFSCRIVCLL
jgi:uncharacterized protein YjbI with pentapeptide repeats